MLTIWGALWNLFLLAIPFALILILEKFFLDKLWENFSTGKKLGFLFLFALFILFFPNIPYIFTDVRHILDHCSADDYLKRCYEAPWVTPLLFTFSALAIPFFVLSMRKSAELLGQLWHPLWRKLTPPILIALAALGVVIGLFDRLNSWDALRAPMATLQIVGSYFSSAPKFALWLTFALCFAAIFYFFQYFFAGAEKTHLSFRESGTRA